MRRSAGRGFRRRFRRRFPRRFWRRPGPAQHRAGRRGAPIDALLIQSIFSPAHVGDTRRVTALRRLKLLWLALAVAVANVGLPVLGYAAIAGPGGLPSVICTPGGMKTIVVDDDGQVREVGTQALHDGHCALCAMPAALPVSTSTPAVPGLAGPGASVPVRDGLHARFTAATPPATGPPARG